jgi:hypothetical protein
MKTLAQLFALFALSFIGAVIGPLLADRVPPLLVCVVGLVVVEVFPVVLAILLTLARVQRDGAPWSELRAALDALVAALLMHRTAVGFAAVRHLGSGLLAICDNCAIVCGCCGLFAPCCRCEVEYIGPHTEKFRPHERDVGPCDYEHHPAWFFMARGAR